VRHLFAALAWLALPAAVAAQTANSYSAVVSADGVELRSGPGDGMEATGPFPRGEPVRVLFNVGEQWVAVTPPLGQISWVRSIHLKEVDGRTSFPRNMIVDSESPAEVAAGRPGHAAPLKVRKPLLPNGTIVVALGSPAQETDAGGKTNWTPILPAEGDVRYLPRSAIRPTDGAAAASFTVTTPATANKPAAAPEADRPPVTSMPAAASRAVVGKPADWPSDPLWRQAEEAFRRGEYDRAERLYLQLASNVNQTGGDPDLANLCFSRVHEVRAKQRAAGRPERQRAGVSRSGDQRAAESKWSYAGRVRETGFRNRGEPRYSFRATEGPDAGKVVAYLMEGSNVDLGEWREGSVELYGTSRPGDRANDLPTLTVERVRRAEARRE
jgi:hypothetical protein